MSFSRRPPPRIEFLCEPRDKGVIAEPVPAKAELPEWFRRIPPIDAENLTPTSNGLTVKRCMPFFDALATGWIIPLAATVRLEVTDDGSTVNAGWEFDRTLVSYHGPHQVRGNPREPRPPCKFHNFWDVLDAAGLELPLRAAAQPRQLRVRDPGGRRRYGPLRLAHPLPVLRHGARRSLRDPQGHARRAGDPEFDATSQPSRR